MTDEYKYNSDFKSDIGNDLALANGAVLTVINSGRVGRSMMTLRNRFSGAWTTVSSRARSGSGKFVVSRMNKAAPGRFAGSIKGTSSHLSGAQFTFKTGADASFSTGSGFSFGPDGVSANTAGASGMPDDAGKRAGLSYNAGKTTVFVESSPSAGGSVLPVREAQYAVVNRALSDVSAFAVTASTRNLLQSGSTVSVSANGPDAVGSGGAGAARSGKRSFTINADDAAKFTSCQLGGATAISGGGTAIGKSCGSIALNSGYYTEDGRSYDISPSIGVVTGGPYSYAGGSPFFDESTGEYIYRPCPWYGWIEIDPPFTGYHEFVVWEEYSIELDNEWVHFDDGEYSKIDLEYAAKLSFTVNTKDAAKFTVYRCVAGEDGSYSLTELQTTSLSLNGETDEYEATTKALLLEAGEYYISIQSANAAEDGSDYKVYLNDDETEFFTEGDNSDDWTDLKTEGLYGEVGYAGLLDEYCYNLACDWVGYGDEIDYMGFTLSSAAKLSFTLDATDAAKFTLYQLVQDKNGTYSLKTIQSTLLSFDKEFEDYEATTKALLLEAGDYYFSMQSTNAAQGGSASYDVYLNDEDSAFFTEGDNWDDWTDLRTEGECGQVGNVGLVDECSYDILSGWVGYGDAVDYAGFTLTSAAKLSFTLDATDAASFTIYQLIRANDGTYSLKALQTTGLSFDKEMEDYEATTKSLLLDAGDYYFSVQSTNAAQGGNAYYNVYLNGEDSEFFVEGCDWDDWTDVRTEGMFGSVGYVGVVDECSYDILSDWVGFGDSVDYAGFTLTSAAKLSFSLDASGAAKFTIYQLIQAKDGTYSLKSLQTTSLSFDKEMEDYEATTKSLLLEAGDYYFSVQSTNASQGGSAYYNVYLNGEGSEFFPESDSSDSWADIETAGPDGAVGYAGVVDEYTSEVLNGWVGFNDTDFARIDLYSAAKLSFSIDATGASKFTIYQLVQAKNGSYSLNALQTTSLKFDKDMDAYAAATKALLLEAGEYYISVESTNAAQGGNAYYNVNLNSENSEFFTEGSDWDDWTDIRTEGMYGSVGYVGVLDEYSFDFQSDWVGFGDSIDYAGFTLFDAAKLSFTIDATDAASFTIYQLVQAKNGMYSLIALQTTALTFNKEFEAYDATTKSLLLEAGEYYFSVQSTNAQQGGSAYYNVYLNGEDSVFYTEIGNWDDWTDVRTNGPDGEVGDIGVLDEYSFELQSDWVGFGDSVDYARFSIWNAASLSFTIDATDAANFTIYQLVQSKNGSYSLNALQTTALTFNKELEAYDATTKSLLLEAGEYYFSVQSANAQQGGSAYYNVYLNYESSQFFTDGGNWDDWTDVRTNGPDGEVGDIGILDEYASELVSDWVGFGDSVDYMRFSIWNSANLSFTIDATGAASFTIHQLVQANNGTYTLKTLQTTSLAYNKTLGNYEATTKSLLLEAGDYYFSVQSANASQGGSSYYNLKLNQDASEFFADDDDSSENWVAIPTGRGEFATGSVAGNPDASVTGQVSELMLPNTTGGTVDDLSSFDAGAVPAVEEKARIICRYPAVDTLTGVSELVVESVTCVGSATGLANGEQPENKRAALLDTATIV